MGVIRPIRQTATRPGSRRVASGSLATIIAGTIAIVPAAAAGASPRAGLGDGSATSVAKDASPLAAFTDGAPYRTGVLPSLAWERAHRGVDRSSSTTPAELIYNGGTDGVGVTIGHEHVYLVFWGSQWGKQSTGSNGYTVFSGDRSGVAPRLQAFFKGLGTSGDSWSGVMTQYCQGVPAGSTSCPKGTYHVAYPTGGALSGVWEDTSGAAPLKALASQIATEANRGAAHFGSTTAASNRDAQYIVVSPTGTDPDGYKENGFCAWHNYTGPTSGGGSPYGPLAYTNLPYIPDAGKPCGANYVNAGPAGLLDGVTLTVGHEYAETVTDQFPEGGWIDSGGEEAGDKCDWILPGQVGGALDIHLTTGSFAVQSIWANDGAHGGGCDASHPIVENGNIISVSNPGAQAGQPGRSASLQIHAGDSARAEKLTYSATGLPPGLAISASTGLVSGTPNTTGTYPVTVMVKDPTGSYGSTIFNWTIGTSPATWRTVGTPDPSTSYDELVGLSCPSTLSCTAVGISGKDHGDIPLIEQWNGHIWAASSSLTHIWGQLYGISCPSTSYCAAVGYVGSTSEMPLAAEWLHGQWAVEKLAVPTGWISAGFSSVSCVSPTSCVAVGNYTTAVGGQEATLLLAAQWNGVAWKLVTIPSPKNVLWSSLTSVSCSSPTACEAVGSDYSVGGQGIALAERWNGTAWVLQTLPGVSGAAGQFVTGLSCSADGVCMAVGSSYATYGGETPTYWMWHGTSWSAPVSTPQPTGSIDTTLDSVSCYGAGDCTVAGNWTTGAHVTLTWAEAWNGAHWLIEQTPDTSHMNFSEFFSISCTSSSICGAAGSNGGSTGATHTFVNQTF
jgi:serine protease